MRKIMSIALILISVVCYGQKYKKCTVYTIQDGDTVHIKEQLYNRYGKVDKATGYKFFKIGYDTIKHADIIVKGPKEKSGETIYYYNDILLEKKIEFYYKTPNCTNNGETIADTIVNLYFYNENKILTKEISTYYGRHKTGCMINPFKKWGDSIVTFYKYNGKLLIESLSYHLDEYSPGLSFELATHLKKYSYDKANRPISIKRYHIGSLMDYKSDTDTDTVLVNIDTYRYEGNKGYFIENHADNVSDTTEYTYDKKGQLINAKEFYSYSSKRYNEFEYSYHPKQRIDRETNHYSEKHNQIKQYTYQ